jgi:hypothetical protein
MPAGLSTLICTRLETPRDRIVFLTRKKNEMIMFFFNMKKLIIKLHLN